MKRCLYQVVLFLILSLCIQVQARKHYTAEELEGRKPITKPALGMEWTFGDLYNGRKEEFCGEKIFLKKLGETDAIRTIERPSSNLEFIQSHHLSDKIDKLGIDVLLGLYIDLVIFKLDFSGHAKYLIDRKVDYRKQVVSFVYEITTVDEMLNIFDSELGKSGTINDELLEVTNATHVVTGIRYGAKSVIKCDFHKNDESDRDNIFLDISAHLEVGKGGGKQRVKRAAKKSTIVKPGTGGQGALGKGGLPIPTVTEVTDLIDKIKEGIKTISNLPDEFKNVDQLLNSSNEAVVGAVDICGGSKKTLKTRLNKAKEKVIKAYETVVSLAKLPDDFNKAIQNITEVTNIDVNDIIKDIPTGKPLACLDPAINAVKEIMDLVKKLLEVPKSIQDAWKGMKEIRKACEKNLGTGTLPTNFPGVMDELEKNRKPFETFIKKVKDVTENELGNTIDMIMGFFSNAGGVGGSIGFGLRLNKTEGWHRRYSKMNFTFYGDVLPEGEILPTTFEGVIDLINELPGLIQKVNGGKGKPIEYRLMPIPVLRQIRSKQIKAAATLRNLQEGRITQILLLFDKLKESKFYLQQFYQNVLENREFVTRAERLEIFNYTRQVDTVESDLKNNVHTTLVKLRSGIGEETELDRIIENFTSTVAYPKTIDLKIESWELIAEKIRFGRDVTNQGAHFVRNRDFAQEYVVDGNVSYALYFKNHRTMAMRNNAQDWGRNKQLLYSAIRDRPIDPNLKRNQYLVVDCEIAHADVCKTPNFTSILKVFLGGNVTSEDLLEERRRTEDNCGLMLGHLNFWDKVSNDINGIILYVYDNKSKPIQLKEDRD